VSCGPYANSLQYNAHPLTGSSARERGLLPGGLGECGLLHLLACPERFQEAEGHIAMARILPEEQQEFLSEDRQAEGSVAE